MVGRSHQTFLKFSVQVADSSGGLPSVVSCLKKGTVVNWMKKGIFYP